MYSEIPEWNPQLSDFHSVLEQLWCRETCSASVRDMWTPEFPSFGQCFVTALAVQQRFGGEIRELHQSMGAIHFYNCIEGKIVDLTAEQFGLPVSHCFYADGVLTDVPAKLRDAAKQQRWEVLQAALQQQEAAG